MNRPHNLSSLIVTIFSLMICLCCTAEDFFYIFKDGKAMTSIILPENLSYKTKKSVEEFRNDIKKGYNIDIPVGTESNLPGKIKLFVEKRPLETEDQTEITFPNNNTMEIKGGESGVRRTLFYLLEEFGGVRYLYQSGVYGTHFPDIKTIAVPVKNFKHNSCFPLGRLTGRTNYKVGVRGSSERVRKYFWTWEVRLGAKGPLRFNHALTASPQAPKSEDAKIAEIAFPLRDYKSGKKKVSEKIFPILHGKRFLPYKHLKGKRAPKAWQPCFSSPETVEEAASNILEYLRKHPDTVSLPLGVNDNGNHCECKSCLKMDNNGGKYNSQGYKNRSESYYRWVNAVVSRVAKEFPDVRFGLIAYREVLNPPIVKLHKSVIPILCFDFNSTIDKEVEKERKKLIKDWSLKADNIGFWAYDLGFTCFTLPRIYYKEQKEMIKFYSENKGKFGFSSGAHYFTLVEGPKVYLHFKLTENPDLDLEKTIMDWCEAAVGKDAAPYLRKYYAFWEDFWRNKATKTPWWESRRQVYMTMKPFGSYMYGLEPGDMAKCRTILDKVVTIAKEKGNKDQKKRAKVIRRIFDWYDAAAKVCSAELRSSDGSVSSPEQAIGLIRSIPEAVKSYSQWRNIPSQIKGWIAWDLINKNADPGIILDTLMAVGSYAKDPQVKDGLKKLSLNKDIPANLCFVAEIILKGADSVDSDNLITDGSFEKDRKILVNTTHKSHGKISREKGKAASGDYSLKCLINHNNFTVNKIVHGLKPNTSYYFAARVYIPADQKASLEGRLHVWGNPIDKNDKNRTWPVKIPEFRLSAGKWNYVSAVVSAHPLAVGNSLNMRFKNFERGTVAYIDDMQLIEIPAKK